MRVEDKTVVITGGASGIGRAMAERFAGEGARVVIADVDVRGAARIADEIGGLAVRLDVTDAEATAALIELCERQYGGIDLFCANAGAGEGDGIDTPDEMWQQCFDVNVKAHVIAARLLMPAWLERGEGYFLSTASAAGLLGVVGSPTYPVTKHATVAFAEWLAFTYGDRGVKVSCLCPMGVRTPFLEAGFALPGEAGAGLRISNAAGELLDPAVVADAVVEGLGDERFLILPHKHVADMVRFKANDRDAWLAVMGQARAAAAADVAAADAAAAEAAAAEAAAAEAAA